MAPIPHGLVPSNPFLISSQLEGEESLGRVWQVGGLGQGPTQGVLKRRINCMLQLYACVANCICCCVALCVCVCVSLSLSQATEKAKAEEAKEAAAAAEGSSGDAAAAEASSSSSSKEGEQQQEGSSEAKELQVGVKGLTRKGSCCGCSFLASVAVAGLLSQPRWLYL